jgi:DNA processing protein
MSPEESCAWIALNMLPGIGALVASRALERWRDPATLAYHVPFADLTTVRGFRSDEATFRETRRNLRRHARDEWRRCCELGVRLLVRGTADYPAALEEIPDPPFLLYAWGELPPGVVRIGIVGSRRPTSYGVSRAEALAGELADRGIEIVSGGARGVDTLAHQAALANGGRTVAVLGSGLEQQYPRENRGLFRRIADRGAVLSEFPLEVGPKPGHFPRRNRVISGLAAAVLVIEANARSGSLITARFAAEQGREVMAVPGPVNSPRSVGCNRLIQAGAKLVQNAFDVTEELSPMYSGALTGSPPVPAPPRTAGLPPRGSADEIALIRLLDRCDSLHLDELAAAAPFGLPRLQLALLGLQVQGAVEALPGGYYRRRRP